MDTLVPLVLSLSSVTVYPKGGLYTYTGLLSADKGPNHYVWAALPPRFDQQSLRVSVPPSARGYIVQAALEPYSPTWQAESPDVKQLRLQVDSLEGVVTRLQNRLRVLQLQESTLTQNTQLGGEESPVQPEQVEKYLALVERQLSRLLEEKYPLQKRLAAAQDTLRRWKVRYESRMAGLDQQRAALFLTYWSPQKEVLPLRVELVAPTTSWSLFYRIRAFPAAGQVRVQRWASVSNLSGEDWKGLAVTLSTARPSRTAHLPPFSSWYLDFMAPLRPAKAAGPELQTLSKDEPAPEERGGDHFAEETFALPLPAVSEQILSRTYELGRQTLPTGQRNTQFFLKEDTLLAQFQFFVNAPEETRAYLRAALPPEGFTLWEKAPATLEVEGQEAGTIDWPPPYAEDTLWLDLGPTDRVQVRRTETLNRRESRLTGGTVSHRFAYTLRIEHFYPVPIRLTVWDRLPVSRHSDIKVQPEDLAGALLEETTGKLRWDLRLSPGEVWEKTFRFTVKYPKGKLISGL